ncbi:Uncharacterised protein [Chlamydia trachomatis]|nr:Uncharacterised protein [Chlamydia trachomatis]
MLNQLAVILHFVALNAKLVCNRTQMLNRSFRRNLLAQSLRKRAVHGNLLPLAAKIVLFAVKQSHLSGAESVDSSLLDQLFSKSSNRIVSAISLVSFEHCKLWSVSCVYAFVSKITVDFKHAVNATNQAALQEKLWRNTQIKINVESIHVSCERTSSSTAVNRLQHWCFDFQEVVAVESAAKRSHGMRTPANHIANLLVRNHANIRLTRTSIVA